MKDGDSITEEDLSLDHEGKTILDCAATIFEKPDTDNTKLWHMRPEHAGEKALQALVKQGLLKGAKTCKLDFCLNLVLLCIKLRESWIVCIHMFGVLPRLHH
ncbi:hypothetical protein PS2_031248 [Malus domestica]